MDKAAHGPKIGMLHLGLGAFHRAHQAYYTQEAMAKAGGDWGIEAVAMRNPALADALNAQDGRYGLITRHPDGPALREITAIRSAIALPRAPERVIARFADPGLHVVTITVTEKGYGADIAARLPNWQDPVIAHDLEHPAAPKGVIGVITAGLAARREAGLGWLTILCCDNLPDNGRVLEAVVFAFAARRDPELAAWIRAEVTFPNSMVDRITPASTEDTFATAKRLSGRDDPVAVETEPFHQWVIEDKFAGPRPNWEAAGALIVPDVRPYENMKLRLLNGSHSMIAYLGALVDLPAVRDVMTVPAYRDLVRAHMDAVTQSLTPPDGFAITAYRDDLIERFANPAIEHLCLQIAMDGSQKLPQRIFEPALDLIARGQSFETCALATALWAQFLSGTSEAGEALRLNDPLAEDLKQAVRKAQGDAGVLVAELGDCLGGVATGLWAADGWQARVTAFVTLLRENDIASSISEALRDT